MLRQSASARKDAATHFDALVAIVDAVKAPATAPRLVALDEVYQADKASLAAHSFVGRKLRYSLLLMFATYRDAEVLRGHRLAAALGDLARERLAEWFRLSWLPVSDVEVLIDKMSGMDASMVATG